MKNSDLFLRESDYPDIPYAAAAGRLSRAVSFPTVSYTDTSRIDYAAFDGFREFLRGAYPAVAERGTWENVGRSLLITIPGTDPSLRPALFLAHQDVVPVVPGTERDWIHAPFSGDIDGGFIWGRGTLDIKEMLIAEMECAEYFLSRGVSLKRTVMLAFGEDEESLSHGAQAVAGLLEARGVTPEYVLDEGSGDVVDAADWGAPGTLLCTVGVYEKGYGDLRLRASSRGGHSSDPFLGTSLGALCEAVTAILHGMPPARLSLAVRRSLKELLPRITQEPMRTWAADPDRYEKEILGWFSRHKSLYHMTQTTAAPTMIRGGSPAGNVMPQDMEAVINFRMIPEDTPDLLLERCRALAAGKAEADWIQAISASVPSDTDSYGYSALTRVLEKYFGGLVFIPVQNKGYTDARRYEKICHCVMRFGPFLEEEDISRGGIHGTNERISIRAFSQGIRAIARLMEDTCAHPDTIDDKGECPA